MFGEVQAVQKRVADAMEERRMIEGLYIYIYIFLVESWIKEICRVEDRGLVVSMR